MTQNTSEVIGISVLVNDKKQAILFRDGDWGWKYPRILKTKSDMAGTSLWEEDKNWGLASSSSLIGLMGCKEFYLGTLHGGTARTITQIDIIF